MSQATNVFFLSINSRKVLFYHSLITDRRCPNLPTIPHGFILAANETDTVVITFACQKNLTLINPSTNESSDGRIECHKGLEWVPYPFPVCRPHHPEEQNVANNGIEESSTLIKADPIWFVIIGSFLCIVLFGTLLIANIYSKKIGILPIQSPLVKGSRLNNAYTTISSNSSDSSVQSDHTYDRIDEKCDARSINYTNNIPISSNRS